MSSKMKSLTIHVQMGVLEVIGSDIQNLMKDVPNFVKDVPNFVKDIPNFVKDVPSVPKCIPGWGSTPNLFLMGSKMKIMYHPCLDRGPESNRIGCTKFCEGCTKGSKMRSKVRIGPQTLPYWFQNEIMDYPYSDGGPRSDRIGCTKFNEGCTKFCEGCTKFYKRCTKFCKECTKGTKVHFEMGNNLRSLPECL